jgi:hypothetical protein
MLIKNSPITKAIRDHANSFFHAFFYSNPVICWLVGAAIGLLIKAHLHTHL